MTLSGSCADCGAPLVSGDRACPICATPAAVPPPAPLVAPRPVAGLPMAPQTAVFVAVLALGFGGVVGSALNGGLGGLIASASPTPPATVVAEATAPDTALTGGGGTGGGGGSSKQAPAPAAAPPATEVPVAPPTTLPEDPPLDPPLDPPEDPPKPEQDRVSGTVVRVNPLAESYSVADGTGALTAVHAEKLPQAGAIVQAPVDPLFNATFAEAGRRKEDGTGKNVTFAGTVTWVDEKAGTYVVSSAGSSVVVTVPEPEQGARDLPELTAGITVKAEIAERGDDPAAAARQAPEQAAAEDAAACVPEQAYPEEPALPAVELRQVSYEVDFDSLSYALLEGVVQAVCEDDSEIVVSADDVRELGADLVLSVPKQIDPALVEEGMSITAAIDPEAAEDGTNALYGIAGDDGTKGADDEDLGQGDLAK